MAFTFPNPFGDLANTLAGAGPTNQNDWMQRIQQFRQRFGQGGFPTGQGGQMPWGMPREPWGGVGTGQKPPVGQSPVTGTQPPPQMGQGGQTPLGTQGMMPWRVPMPPPPAQAPAGGQTGTFANSQPGQTPPVQLPGQVTAPAPPPAALGGQNTGTFTAPGAQTQQQQPTPIGNIIQPQQGSQTQPQQNKPLFYAGGQITR